MDGSVPVWNSEAAHIELSATPENVGYDKVLRSVGQSISVLLVKNGADGVRLKLPSGQIISAEGNLPFSEMTQLRVRVSIQDGVIRLQTLEAISPSPASILGPLIRGEANALIQQLTASEIPEALMPLARLFISLAQPEEQKIQQSIDSLPASTRNMLSILFGIKDYGSGAIAQNLINKFEPAISLFGAEVSISGKQASDIALLLNNEQKTFMISDALIDNLKNIFLKWFDLNSSYLEKNVIPNINLNSAIKSEFLSQLFAENNEIKQELLETDLLAIASKKLQLAINQLPLIVRNNVSNYFVGNVVDEIHIIANAILAKLGVDQKFIPAPSTQIAITANDNHELIQAIKNLPLSLRRELIMAVMGSPDADVKIMADFLSNKDNMLNSDESFYSRFKSVSHLARKIITLILEMTRPTSHGLFSPHTGSEDSESHVTSTRSVPQRLAQIIDSMPATVRRDLAHAVLGTNDAEPIGISEFIFQRDSGSGAAKENIQTASHTLRQMVNLLNELARSVNSGGGYAQGGTIEITNAGHSNISDSQQLAQIFENMSASIRRALSLAISGSPEAKPIDIASFFINSCLNVNVNTNLSTQLDSASHLLRQMVAIIAQLPLESSAQKIAESLINGDRSAFMAAKGFLSIDAGVGKSNLINFDAMGSASPNEGGIEYDSIESTMNLINSNIKEKLLSITFADRFGYLLGFERLNAQQLSSSAEKNEISSWFRSIVDQLIMAKSAKTLYQETNELNKTNWASLSNNKNANSIIGQATNKAFNTPAENPQTWQSWLKGSIKALVDPSISSKDALFHTIVAREGVNYFHLPLPWMPSRAMEMWIEDEVESDMNNKKSNSFRVLLALNFSVIGETRIGLESSGKTLLVKIWVESPHLVEKELPNLRNEIVALGFDAHVSLQAMNADSDGAISSIKSVILGSSLHALG